MSKTLRQGIIYELYFFMRTMKFKLDMLKNKKLLFRSGRIGKGGWCAGISFRLRFSELRWDKVAQYIERQLKGTNNYPDNGIELICQH